MFNTTHFEDFANLPGWDLFMMVLDICNVSAATDISSASELLLSKKLSQYAGENIESSSLDAIRFIKIMQIVFALPYATGLKILLKVSMTKSAFFHCKILAIHDKMSEIEEDGGQVVQNQGFQVAYK